jgi:hypothetical protein
MTFAPCVVWQRQDSEGGGERHCSSPSMNANDSWRGSPLERDGVVERLLPTSCLVGQPLAACAPDGAVGALDIVDAEFGAVVVPEIEFGEVAVEMLLVHVLIDADQTALEHREEAFEGVGVHVAPDVLALGMIDRFMLTGGHKMSVCHRAIGDETAIAVQIAPQYLPHSPMIEELRTDRATALNQAEDLSGGALMRLATGLRRFADPSLISLDSFASATNRASAAAAAHHFADAMPKEPRSFHATAEGALQLARRDAFLGRANEVDRLKPDMHRDVAGLEHAAHADGERLAASAAIPQTGASGFTLRARCFADRAAVRANRAVGPHLLFDVFESGVFVGEARGVEYGFHGGNSLTANHIC